jgi:hypothetical protein
MIAPMMLVTALPTAAIILAFASVIPGDTADPSAVPKVLEPVTVCSSKGEVRLGGVGIQGDDQQATTIREANP